MMPIEILQNEIYYAEAILLGGEKKFDDEQRKFILNLKTIDLQAVPGSGKTLALLAKLLILEKKLPFADGSGILVISHTNAAIDEIESKIKKQCPRLFSYPNFIGTIQAFVDKFIAISSCIHHYGIRPIIVDSDTFESMMSDIFKFIYWNEEYEKPGAWLYNKYKSRCSKQDGSTNRTIVDKKCINDLINAFIKNIRFNLTTNEVVDTSYSRVFLRDQNNPKNLGFKLCFEGVVSKGVIPYDFAYQLSEFYLSVFTSIKEIIKSRFKFVFVDEMQDLDQDQVDLLENIFYDKNHQDFCFQRIGDKNQAIFHPGDFFEGTCWNSEGRLTLPLSGSHRLTFAISKIVEKFGVENTAITSLNSTLNEQPKIILYKEEKIQEVLPLFAGIVKRFIESNETSLKDKLPIKAIGWRKDRSEGITLTSYYPPYTSISSSKRNYGPSLWADLNEAFLLSSIHSAFKPIYKAIWNAFYSVLRFENYSKINLIKSMDAFQEHFRNIDDEVYQLTEKSVFDWCFRILCGEIELVYSEIIEYMNEIITGFFGIKIKYSMNYLDSKQFEPKINNQKNENIFMDEETGLQFEVCTVHSVKGKTLLATLYMETYYYNDNGKSYESQRLIDCFRGQFFNADGKRKRQSAKMVYVGFSRAKYLLCFAANLAHFNDADLAQLAAHGWEINKELCN